MPHLSLLAAATSLLWTVAPVTAIFSSDVPDLPRLRVTDDAVLPGLDLPFRIRRFEPEGDVADESIPATEHVVSMQREKTTASPSFSWVNRIRNRAMWRKGRLADPNNGTAGLYPVANGQVFLAALRVNDFNYATVMDTGSADPWLVSADFNCSDPGSGQSISPELCYFGPQYNASASPTFQQTANQFFRISYASGERLTGIMGNETMSMGGITVTQQQFGVVNNAAWYGDGVSSGLVGLASYYLTSAYAGTDPSVTTSGSRRPYNPLFTSMYKRFGVPAVFSMVLERDAPDLSLGGLLGLGGVPAVPHTPGFASSPIRIFGIDSAGEYVYQFYEIAVEGFAISANRSTQFNPYDTNNPAKQNLIGNGTSVIIDSGTSLTYLPEDVASAVFAAYSPPAWLDSATDFWMVDCNATAAVFGVQVGKKVLYANAQDMIVAVTSDRSQCISGVQPDYGGLSILGDVWMKSVVSVFDLRTFQMRFAARKFYGLTETSVTART